MKKGKKKKEKKISDLKCIPIPPPTKKQKELIRKIDEKFFKLTEKRKAEEARAERKHRGLRLRAA